jgi:hypothetical protein
MKTIPMLFVILANIVFGNDSQRLWLELSAVSQNLAYSIQQSGSAFPNLELNEEEIDELNGK